MFPERPLGAAALLAAMVAGCAPAASEGEQAAANAVAQPGAAAATAPDYSKWAGTWTGPEGLFVTISDAGEGGYTLDMQSDLDTRGTYTGSAAAEGISFERGGETRLLRKASGAETGLKYLADKQDCLMVEPGEGYCRD